MSFNDEYRAKKGQRRDNMRNKRNNYHNNKGKGGRGSHSAKHQAMMDIYYDTQKLFSSMKRSDVEDSTRYNIDTMEFNVDLANLPALETTYVVENEDTLDMALEFHKDGFHPLVLNMASKFKPGGGVQSGKTAQEECIFRRSNAFMTHPEKWYPLESNQVIYSPEVQVIKDSNYKMLHVDDQEFVSMIAVPAIKNPRLVKYKYREDDRDLMFEKIESIFKIALLNGHDSLVLGAMGCGAYNNPPAEVVEIFKELTDKYGKYFKKIGFAILCVRDSDTDNLRLFQEQYK